MRLHSLWLSSLCLALACTWTLAAPARAQNFPPALKGKIITNTDPIDVPSSAKGFLPKLKKQDRSTFKRDAEDKWVIHFVAFFDRALPGESMGVVVLDAKQEPVAVAEVAGTRGQKTLASQIVIDTTESPGKQHTLQVYFARGGKPVVLAKKQVLLK